MAEHSAAPEPPLLVTAMLLESDGAILAAERRNPPDLAGKWEFPGGKLIPGESPQACLAREIREELGIDVEAYEAFDVSYHEYPDGRSVLILCYKCRFNGKCRPDAAVGLEGQRIRWVEASRLLELPWVPADIPIVRRYLNSIR